MDALALLSDDDEEVDDEDEDDATSAGAEEEQKATLDFGSLKRAGYEGNKSLSETEMYKRAGSQAEPAATVPQREPAPPPSQSDVVAAPAAIEPEALEALQKAKQRDRKRAGVHGTETNRQKNARKMKMGQASFSLKDDRDCVNPFVDKSNAPHVASYSGKRVDKRASVKQISNLSFTS
eukprot:TRINITY_DN60406_c0_g1_i1.p1 TRINITY_DN60406_c0_g1~~TRINITY_DN60406_c0_g1_i1.p1  ORF type:complete len:179 (-),score=42.73 TRINITY_DN60406_c0_g1_i1:272-808(-)